MLIEAPLEGVAGEVVNIATGIDIPVADVAALVIEAVGDPPMSRSRTVEERPGQVDQHLGSTAKLERPHGLARPNELRRRAGVHGRVVPRERGLVAGDSPAPRRPRLLVLGAGPAQFGLLEAARRRGLLVIAADRDRRRPGSARRRAGAVSTRRAGLERLARPGFRSTESSRREPTGRLGSRRGSPSGSGFDTRSIPRRGLATTKSAPARALRGGRRPQPHA